MTNSSTPARPPLGKDGTDHINIYSRALTELGRWLSNFSHTPIDIPHHGHFSSIEGYWYWLSCRDDRLRPLSGYTAKMLGRKLRTGTNYVNCPNFTDLIKAAIDIKIKADPHMMKQLANSDLPFAHYHEFGRPPTRKDAGYQWIIDHFTDRRDRLKTWFAHQETQARPHSPRTRTTALLSESPT